MQRNFQLSAFAANELNKQVIIVSASGIRLIWMRHNLETLRKRLKILEKAKMAKEAYGEIASEHLGYLGALDTYYVGRIKGISRIYQQTFMNTDSRVAFAKVYTEKTAITVADLLNDKVIPSFESQAVLLLTV